MYADQKFCQSIVHWNFISSNIEKFKGLKKETNTGDYLFAQLFPRNHSNST